MKTLINKSNNIKTLNARKGLGNSMKSRIYTQNIIHNFLILLVFLMTSSSLLAQLNLESIDYSNSLDGSVDISFKFDGNIQKPEAFVTTRPARIALDLDGVYNNSGTKLLTISQGNTKSLRVVSTNDKTRVVIDLLKSAHYKIQAIGNELIVTIAGNKLLLSSQSQNQTDRQYSIEGVDFRRGKDGQGKIIIALDKPGAVINLRESANKIKLEINATTLPEMHDNKLDVIDFATPVSFVDVRARNGNVVIEVMINGNFEHMAYQTGGKYVLEVAEKVEKIETSAQALNKEIVYEGNKVSFNFQDIPVRSVLQLIADASQLNIIAANSVEGSVTLRLNNVPWDQALDTVLNSMQLDKRQTGDVIWIAPAQEIADREQQKLLAWKEKEEFEPLKTIYVQINYAKAEELAALLEGDGGSADTETGGGQGMLSDRGTVTYDARTNTLLISDIPDRLIVVEELIRNLDVAVKQVRIQSRIVIASDKFSKELGVRFGVTGSKQDRNGNIISTGGSIRALDNLNNAAMANRLNNPSGSPFPNFTPGVVGGPILGPSLGDRLNVNLPAAANAAQWAVSILAADYLLDLELSALDSEGRGEVISTPRVVTTNQHTAIIKQGIEIPYITAGGSVSGVSTVAFKEAVLELEVTPLITPDDRVDLSLKVTKDTIGEFFAGVPSVDTRVIETRVLVGNGQTIVLGGVYEQVTNTARTKVPVLGDIPGLGVLFRNKSTTNDKAELLIFVTPTIIKESL
ncbi:MAG: type IV pilus secretin PilQ [Proteobacteria bacterium]|nr:type IV pilus secretin PilQ [Pseudomonadota bacterium]